MYGEDGVKLVAECKRSLDKMTPYNHTLCESVIAEMQTLVQDIVDTAKRQSDFQATTISEEQREEMAQGIRVKALMHQACIKRNKRCLLAYHKHRLDCLKHSSWDLIMSSHLPDKSKDVASNELAIPESLLCVKEAQFYEDYQSLIEELCMQFPDLDLNATLQPPKELFLYVRVLKDCGELHTENGLVRLVKDTQHYLRRTDVERLIAKGYLQHVD